MNTADCKGDTAKGARYIANANAKRLERLNRIRCPECRLFKNHKLDCSFGLKNDNNK